MAVAILSLAGCKPSAEDRLARAEGHFANGDYAAAILESRGALQEEPANLRARVIFAEASRRVGDYRTAAAEFGRARQLGLEDPQALAGYAEVLLVAGQPQILVEELAPALTAEPQQSDRLVLLAHAYATLNQPAEAAQYYREALALDASNAQAYVGLATLADEAGDTLAVEDWLRQADESAPDSAWVSFFRAQRSGDIGTQQALLAQAYDALSAEDSASLRSRILLARVENFLRQDKLDDADRMLALFSETNDGSPQSVFFKALIAFKRGDLERAKEGFLLLSESSEGATPADFFLGSINLAQSNFRQAEAYLNNALRYDIESVQSRKLLAETLLQLGRSRDALQMLAGLNQEQANDPQVLSMMGRASIAAGDARSSIEYFERSAAAAPDNPSLVLATAYSHLLAGDADAALAILETVPEGGDGNYRAELLRMLAHLAARDEQAAIDEAERLIRDHPEDPVAYSLAGQLMLSLDNSDAAIDYYEQALALDADVEAARYGLGQSYVAAEKPDLAYQQFALALDNNPGYFPALAALGSLAESLGRESQAIERVRAAIAANPDQPAPRIVLVQYYLAQDEVERARDEADAGLAIVPDHPGLLGVRGVARLRLGLTESARRDILRAAELSPENRNLMLNKVRLLTGEGDSQEARQTLMAYLAAKPNDVGIKLIAADLDIRSNDLQRAEMAIDQVLADEPQNRAAIILRGDVDFQRGRFEDALRRYDAAAALDADRLVVVRRFATLNRLGRADARSVLEDWLREHPKDTAVETMIAQSLDNAGDREAAIARYESVLERGVESDIQRAVVLNNLAWFYHTRGDARALATARQAYDLAPDSAPIADTLGWILLDQDKLAEALPLLRSAAQKEPDNQDIGYHLAVALVANGESEQAQRVLEQVLKGGDGFASRAEAEALMQTLR